MSAIQRMLAIKGLVNAYDSLMEQTAERILGEIETAVKVQEKEEHCCNCGNKCGDQMSKTEEKATEQEISAAEDLVKITDIENMLGCSEVPIRNRMKLFSINPVTRGYLRKADAEKIIESIKLFQKYGRKTAPIPDAPEAKKEEIPTENSSDEREVRNQDSAEGQQGSGTETEPEGKESLPEKSGTDGGKSEPMYKVLIRQNGGWVTKHVLCKEEADFKKTEYELDGYKARVKRVV